MKKLLIAGAAALTLSTAVFAGGDIEAGKAASATCVSCHGANGTSLASIYPHLGGQYETYLFRTLRRYKSGERQNAIMQGMVAALTETDMKNLAAFYASQPGPLKDGTLNP